MRHAVKIIRNVLLAAIAAIVVLAGVLAFNVVTHGSRQIEVAAVPRACRRASRGGTALRGDPVSDHFQF